VEERMDCPNCGSKNTKKKGIDQVRGVAKQRYICKDCKKNFYNTEIGEGAREENSFEEDDQFINIVCASRRMLNKEEVLKQFHVNMDMWEVERYRVKTSEGYRKDRSVEWHVKNGLVESGDVSDSGKMLVVPLYHIEIRLVRKTARSASGLPWRT
jgi:hypothetical protein